MDQAAADILAFMTLLKDLRSSADVVGSFPTKMRSPGCAEPGPAAARLIKGRGLPRHVR